MKIFGRMKRLAIGCWLSLFFAAVLFLQGEDSSPKSILLFENGDRITGELLEEVTPGILRFQSPLLGILEIPEDRAQVVSVMDLQSGNPKTEALVQSYVQFIDIERSAEEDTASLPASGQESRSDPVSPEEEPKNVEGEPEEPPFWSKPDVPGLAWIRYPSAWKGRLRFSFISLDGQTSDFSFNFDNTITIPRGRDVFEVRTRYDYASSNDGASKRIDHYDALLRYDHEISENRFFQAETFYGANQIKLINEEFRQTVGYGIIWNGSKRYEFQIVPGISGSNIDQENFENPNDWVVLGRIFQSFNFQFNEDYSLNQTIEGFVEAQDPENYKINFRVGLLGSLTQKLALELDYEYDLDNTLSNQINQEQSRFRANLIYRY